MITPDVKLAYGPWGDNLNELTDAAKAAEDAGFSSVWLAELHRSAFVPATAVAISTSTVAVGTGIAYAFTRSEMATALAALDLDDVSDGRFILGLGTGVRRMIEDWHHMPFGKPAAHIRESIDLIRCLVAQAETGHRIEVQGEHVTVDIRGFERPFASVRTSIPIYLGAVGPLMTRTAGEVADGWLAHELGSPHYLREYILPNLLEGLRRSSRETSELTRVASAVCVPHRDSKQAKRWAAGLVAFYASVRTYTDFFDLHGFASEVRRIQELYRDGDIAGMVDATTDDMVDAFVFAGTPDEIRIRLNDYDGIADVIKLTPPTHIVSAEVTRAVQHSILELFAT